MGRETDGVGRTILAFAAVVCLWSAAVRAQGFEEAVNVALKLYKAGEYTEAKKSLAVAGRVLDTKKAEQWTALFPPVPQGWRALSAEITSPLFGGESIRRKYIKGDSIVTVSIEQGGLSGMALAVARPALLDPTASAAERKAAMEKQGLEEVDGFLCMARDKDDTPRFTVRICQETTVECKGERASLEEVRAIARGLDCNRLLFWVTLGKMISGPIGKPKSKAENILGTWEGKIEDNALLLEFKPDMSVLLIPKIPKEGELGVMPAKYMVDYDKTPIQLEILDLPMLSQPFRAVLGFDADGAMMLDLWEVAAQPKRGWPASLERATKFTRQD